MLPVSAVKQLWEPLQHAQVVSLGFQWMPENNSMNGWGCVCVSQKRTKNCRPIKLCITTLRPKIGVVESTCNVWKHLWVTLNPCAIGKSMGWRNPRLCGTVKVDKCQLLALGWVWAVKGDVILCGVGCVHPWWCAWEPVGKRLTCAVFLWGKENCGWGSPPPLCRAMHTNGFVSYFHLGSCRPHPSILLHSPPPFHEAPCRCLRRAIACW